MGDPIIKKPVVFFGDDSPFTMDTSIDQRAIPQPAVPVDAVDDADTVEHTGEAQQQPDPAKDSGGSSGADGTATITVTTPPASGGSPAKP